MFARIRSLIAPSWRTVAVARRRVTFNGAIYPLHGIVTYGTTQVSYGILLQENAKGRRRWKIDCSHPHVYQSTFSDDPLLVEVRAWKSGGARPDSFIPCSAGD